MTMDQPIAPRTPFALSDVETRRARERRRKLARSLRQGLLALALLGALVLAVLALRPRAVPVDVALVAHGPLVVSIEESGKTRVVDEYVVSAPVGGELSRLMLEEGDVVKEGDSLARIVSTTAPLLDARGRAEADARLGAALSAMGQADAQESRARVASEQAESELARTATLAQSGSVGAQPLEQARFDARMRAQELASARFASKVAAEQVRLARATLGKDGAGASPRRFVDVLAPVSGRVLRVLQKSAGVVAAGTPLVEVGDPEALEVVADLLTTDAVHVRPGTSASLEGWGGEPLAGRVRKVEPSAFTRPSALGVDEQRVNVVIALTDPREKWAALADGYRVEARLVLWRADDVVHAPVGAVFRHGDGWGAFVVHDTTVRLVPVVVGHRAQTEVEIVAGLAPGDAVVVHPGDRVKDGARVEAR
jgi:HlyD family secretion protein